MSVSDLILGRKPQAKIPGQQPGSDDPNNPAPAPGTEQPAADAPTPAPATGDDPNNPAPAPAPAAEIDLDSIPADKLVEFLNQKRGLNIKSLDELAPAEPQLTDEQKRQNAEKLRNDAIAYGLNKNVFTADVLQAYNTDSAKPVKDIVLPIFAEKLRSLEPDITDDKIAEQFANYFGENEDENSTAYKFGQNEMSRLAQAHLNNKYANVIGIENAYLNDQQELTAATTYRNEIEHSFASIPDTLSYNIDVEIEPGKKEKLSYTFKPSAQAISDVKNEILNSDAFKLIRQMGVKEADLKVHISNAILVKEHNRIVAEVAESHAAAMLKNAEAGRKAIPADNIIIATGQEAPKVKGHSDAIIEANKKK